MQLLEAAGIRSAWGFTQLSPAWVHKQMSVVGLRMWKELRGKPCIGFKQHPANKKQIAMNRTFGCNIADYQELHQRVAQYITSSTAKLWAQHSVCSEVRALFLMNRFRKEMPQHYENCLRNLFLPTDNTLLRNCCARYFAWALPTSVPE